MNAVEIADAVSELASQPFDSNEFPYSFLEAFGNPSTTIKKLRSGSTNKSDCDGILQRNNIHIAIAASGDINSKLSELRGSKATAKNKVKFLLVTDGKSVEAEDIYSGETIACLYSDLADCLGFFLPLAGITTEKHIRENSFDIRATARLNKLYVRLLQDNKEWGLADHQGAMNHFMARLIFCFFAEDTDIFGSNVSFSKTIEQMSNPDSSNTHVIIGEVFRSMSLSKDSDSQSQIPRWALPFPYVNGGLFDSNLDVPFFSKIARSYLLHIGSLDWTKINPDIFGSMIQAVADEDERGELGMHYTSVPNILKVLNPLFLDELRGKLSDSSDNRRMLVRLRNRICKIRILDPACGSGNFLVIAYKELRKIEDQINFKLGDIGRKSGIPLTNFRGIELRSFSVEIARLSLIIAQYQCDVLYLGQKEALNELLPLKEMNWINCGNALELDWTNVCPPIGSEYNSYKNNLFETVQEKLGVDFENEGGETYICGNPPYKGTRYQTSLQKKHLKNALGEGFKNAASLDYISGWFFKASKLILDKRYKCAFVTTSSICEGQQVSILWPNILNNGNRISFAYRPFKWRNLAKKNSAVTVVIIGLENSLRKESLLYSQEFGEQVYKKVSNINAYLVAAQNIYVSRTGSSLFGLNEMVMGEKLTDGGNLIFSQSEFKNFIQKYPHAREMLGRLVGAQELIKGIIRYVLIVPEEKLDIAQKIDEISSRLKKVTQMRQKSRNKATQKIANTPYKFDQSRFKYQRKIVVAQLSSETREYYPCDLLTEVDVPMAPSLTIYNPDLWNIALISSRLHLVWIATVCGKLEDRFRYSSTLGWHTFPLPSLTQKNKQDLSSSSLNILLARESHYPKTISELYDPRKMPENLKAAHACNDELLERIYIGRRFKNDTERLERLFALYSKSKLLMKEKTLNK